MSVQLKIRVHEHKQTRLMYELNNAMYAGDTELQNRLCDEYYEIVEKLLDLYEGGEETSVFLIDPSLGEVFRNVYKSDVGVNPPPVSYRYAKDYVENRGKEE